MNKSSTFNPQLALKHVNQLLTQHQQTFHAHSLAIQPQPSPAVYNKADSNGQYNSYPVVKDSAIRPIPFAQLPTRLVRTKSNDFTDNDNDDEINNDSDQKNDKNGDYKYNRFHGGSLRQGWFGKNDDCYLAVDFNQLPLTKASLKAPYPFPHSKNVFISHNLTEAMTSLISHPAKVLNMISKQAVNILSNANSLRPFQTEFGSTFVMDLGLERTNAPKMYLVIIKNCDGYKGKKWRVIAVMSEKRVFEILLPNCGNLSLASVSPRSLSDVTLPLFREAYNNFPFVKQKLLNIVNNARFKQSFVISPYQPKRVLRISYRAFKNCIAESVLNGKYVIIPTIVVKPGMTCVEFKLLVKVSDLEYVFVGLQYYRTNWSIQSIHCNIDRIYYQHILVCLPAGHSSIKSHDELKKYSTVLLKFTR